MWHLQWVHFNWWLFPPEFSCVKSESWWGEACWGKLKTQPGSLGRAEVFPLQMLRSPAPGAVAEGGAGLLVQTSGYHAICSEHLSGSWQLGFLNTLLQFGSAFWVLVPQQRSQTHVFSAPFTAGSGNRTEVPSMRYPQSRIWFWRGVLWKSPLLYYPYRDNLQGFLQGIRFQQGLRSWQGQCGVSA